MSMIVNNQICLHCGACVGSCPTNSIFLHGTVAVEFLPGCTQCGQCESVCPVGAIRRLPGCSPPARREVVHEVRCENR